MAAAFLAVTASQTLTLAINPIRAPFPAAMAAGAGSKTWYLGGYLPESIPGVDASRKVFVTITDNRIVAVSNAAPANDGNLVLNTEDLIFPGLMDMHSHIKYNVLPLWDLARGQFLERHEWRSKFGPYTAAVHDQMINIKGDAVCAAVRWAEYKALSGGTTTLQGIGNDTKCAAGFGVHNPEIASDYGVRNKVRAMTDMIAPDMLGSVFYPLIYPIMTQKKVSYDAAFGEACVNTGVNAWLQEFQTVARDIPSGLKLMTGDTYNTRGATLAEFQAQVANIRAGLSASMKATDIEKELVAMQSFLFGKGADGFVASKPTQAVALDYLTKAGVTRINPSSIRRYIGMFEISIRQSAMQTYKDPESLGIVAHLAEGQRNSPYNKLEYQYAQMYGLAQPGLTIIHGVGMSTDNLKDAASKGISIVWSPFSNLLLYGETLDVATAKSLGINLAIGSDWSPTGSKNLLDELKIARRYLNQQRINTISDRDLVQMATINAAKAVKLDRIVGRVAPGYLADIMLVRRSTQDPYSSLIHASQADVDLTVVGGAPLYGDSSLIAQAVQKWGGVVETMVNPQHGPACSFNKAMWSSSPTAFEGTRQYLQNTGKINPDPVYTCEDPKYAARFAAFVESEVPQNAANRANLRAQYRLDDKWMPMGPDAAPTADGDND